MSKLNILLYHPVRLPVSHYGGTERVAMWLIQTLKAMGHTVSVFAAPGSKMPEGIGLLTNEATLFKKIKTFDVIHGFTKLSRQIEEAIEGRVLVTIHGNGKAGERFHPNTVFLSENHAKRHGATVYVYNGLDPDELIYSEQKRENRFLFISKTNLRVKNLKGAIQYASDFKQNLWIAGGARPFSLRAKCEWKKLLGKDWRWMGALNQEQKARFLITGKALVFPILWNEPFGLVMVEGLMSGTPVFANAYGSVPELLHFAPQCILNGEEQWRAAMFGEVRMPNARECRDWAVAMFDQKVMTQNYLSLYEKIMQGKQLHDHEPVTKITAETI